MTRARSGLLFTALTYGAAALGTLTMRGRGAPDRAWYRFLRKPPAQPPAAVFGPVWTVLYATIAYAGYRLWKAPKSPERTRALTLWGTQLALNAAWTPLFFGARMPRAALADLVVLDVAAAATAVAAAKVDRTASLIVTPYLGWLGFATYLNAGVVLENA